MMNLYTSSSSRGDCRRSNSTSIVLGDHYHHQQPGSTNSSRSSPDGLKFGEKIYFEDVGAAPPDHSSAAGKKLKTTAAVTVSVSVRCQVEGCNVDLSDAKAYYSRHKVCASHSKSPQVIVGGLLQRFCQQCSRFHQLPEFDQGKRSCRRRLAGHNERRRKPPPGSSLSLCYGRSPSSLLDNGGNGGFLMDFSAPARLSSRDPWATAGSANRVPGNHQSDVTGQWFGHSEYPPPDHFLHDSASGPGFPSPGIPPGSQSFSYDTGCALSLLSNQPWSSSTRIRAAASSPRVSNNFISPEGVTIALSSLHDSSMDQISTSFWGFKGAEDTTSTPATGQLSSELEMPQHAVRPPYVELEDSTGYGSSSHHMNWSH